MCTCDVLPVKAEHADKRFSLASMITSPSVIATLHAEQVGRELEDLAIVTESSRTSGQS